jgi:hypothetical protein
MNKLKTLNSRSISFAVLVITSFFAVSTLNTSDAQAQNLPSNRMRNRVRDTGSLPIQTTGNQITGQGSASIGSSGYGAATNYSANANGTATSPTNTANTSTIDLIKTPGGVAVPAASVSKYGTVATQQSTAGNIEGSGKSASTITAEVGKVTFGNQTEAKVTGAKTAEVTTSSSASMDSATNKGNATGTFFFRGSR